MNDNSEDAINEALELLKQEKMINDSLANGTGPWTVVYDSWSDENGSRGGRYACFAKPGQHEEIISDPTWDFGPGDGCPGFSSEYKDGERIITYYQNDKAPAFEPLIIVQRFCDVVPDALILSEEFRLLMNLWQDPQTGNYFLIGNGDAKDPAVRFKDGKVEIRTPILRRYQATRQLDLLLFTDSIVFTRCHVSDESLHDLRIEEPTEERLGYISRAAANSKYTSDLGSYSRVLMKRILPPPQEKSGIGLWEEQQKEYPEFIIGEDEDGNPVKYTCDPDKLANYFGKNSDAPHYLTPVFFKRSVLQPYYDKSEIYTVGSHDLHCLQKWGVEIDNDNLERVAVFLGDLGRDDLSNDWPHWQYHNIPPGYGMSDSHILNQFTYNPEHQFKCKYSELQKEWEQSWGWRLHREPAKQDAGAIKRLRVPLNETEAEFKHQLLNLALVLVDLLNEKSIGKECPEAKNEKGGGISKLECFLKHYSYPHVERDISVLRTVQSMRSRIAAHASGSSGQKYLDEQLNSKTTQEYFVLLLEKVVTMLDNLIAFAVDKAEQSKT